MSVMGLDEVQQVNVLSMVAAVLHLGNITFTERGNYAGVQNDDCKNPLCICHMRVLIQPDNPQVGGI